MTTSPFEKPLGKYVILQSIEHGDRFFTLNHPEEDQTILLNGKLAYNILGYTDTIREAQIFLYGYSSTNRDD